jgi:hypothetical protein
MTLMTGISMLGKMSVGVRKSTSGITSNKAMAQTTKV